MKKALFFITLVVFAENLFSQQIPITNQMYSNPFIYNPAFAGSSDDLFLSGGLRNQWVGINGAPQLRTLSAHTPLLDNMGVGANLFYETAHRYKSVNFQLAYSYKFLLAGDHYLSLGLAGDFQERRLDFSDIDNVSANDPALVGNYGQKGTGFDVNFGLRYNWNELSIGLAALNLIESPLTVNSDGKSGLQYNNARHFILNINYDYEIVEDTWKVGPRASMRYLLNTPVSFDAGAQGTWNELLSLSLLYRSGAGLVTGLGVKPNKWLEAGVFYEWPFASRVNGFSQGSHELYVSFLIAGKDKSAEAYLEEETETQNTSNVAEKQSKAESSPENEARIAQLEKELALVKGLIGFDENYTGPDDPFEYVDKNTSEGIEIIKPTTAEDLTQGHYIVIQSFSEQSSAESKMKELESSGLSPILVLNKVAGIFYIYHSRYNNLKEALVELNKVRASGFPDAWIYMLK